MKTRIVWIAVMVSLLMGASQAMAVDAVAAKALASNKGCFNCHSIDSGIMGPAWKDVGSKYAGDASAPDRLVNKITKTGSKGVWGDDEMPAQKKLTEAEARLLIGFILSLHK